MTGSSVNAIYADGHCWQVAVHSMWLHGVTYFRQSTTNTKSLQVSPATYSGLTQSVGCDCLLPMVDIHDTVVGAQVQASTAGGAIPDTAPPLATVPPVAAYDGTNSSDTQNRYASAVGGEPQPSRSAAGVENLAFNAPSGVSHSLGCAHVC